MILIVDMKRIIDSNQEELYCRGVMITTKILKIIDINIMMIMMIQTHYCYHYHWHDRNNFFVILIRILIFVHFLPSFCSDHMRLRFTIFYLTFSINLVDFS